MPDRPAVDAATLLDALERLLEAPPGGLSVALGSSCDVVAGALGAEKVDALLYEPERDSLVAVGSSSQPLTALQRKLGLDVMQLANGGRAVGAFTSGAPFLSGRIDQDPDELRGVREGLGIRSLLAVPLEVGGTRRGVLTAASVQPERFTSEDLRLARLLARWVGGVAHRAELVTEIARKAVEEGRRSAAEELVMVLAHDLRNLLAPVTVRLDLLRRRAENDQRASDLRELELASRGLHRVTALVGDMLDVARIDQGVFLLEPRPVDLVALVQEVASTLSTPTLPVVVRPYEPVEVCGDPRRLRQCLENLLSNAIQHSPHGAAVVVSLGQERHEQGEMARVDVVDQGPGISGEAAERIFERFATGNGARGGLGLGLYLARRIAMAHGGELGLSSTPGQGARFTLRLPVLRSAC